MQKILRGVVLPFRKGEAHEQEIENFTVTKPIRIPLAKAGDEHPLPALEEEHLLAAGEELCQTDNLPVLSTTAGTISGTVMLNHTLYGELLCAEIQPTDGPSHTLPILAAENITPELILETAWQAGIYDELDGIPLAEKLTLWQLPPNDPATLRSILVADATENDIFGSSAWAILNSLPETALYGLQMAARCLRFSRYHIATMLPRLHRRALKRRIGRENVYTVGDEYPVTVFSDGKEEIFRIGIQACVALAQALKEGQRHTHTVVTLAGDALPAAHNVRVPFGTDISELLSYYQADEQARVILGDAMSGVVCEDSHTPLLPGITTVLALKSRELRTPGPCIGCGRCAAVCHAELLPYEIARRLENMHYERLQHLDPATCDGCAACSYVCPAGRDVAAEVLQAAQTRGTMFLNWGEEDHE